MERDDIVGFVYLRQTSDDTPQSLGGIPLLFVVPARGDTISLPSGHHRVDHVDHVHWVVGPDQQQRPTGFVNLFVSKVGAVQVPAGRRRPAGNRARGQHLRLSRTRTVHRRCVMEREDIVGYVYLGQKDNNPTSLGEIPLLFGVPAMGDTVSLPTGSYRVDHVHWVVGVDDRTRRPTGYVDLFVSVSKPAGRERPVGTP